MNERISMHHASQVALTVAYPKWNPGNESVEQSLSRHWDALVVRDYWWAARGWLEHVLLVTGIVGLFQLFGF